MTDHITACAAAAADGRLTLLCLRESLGLSGRFAGSGEVIGEVSATMLRAEPTEDEDSSEPVSILRAATLVRASCFADTGCVVSIGRGEGERHSLNF